MLPRLVNPQNDELMFLLELFFQALAEEKVGHLSLIFFKIALYFGPSYRWTSIAAYKAIGKYWELIQFFTVY